MNIRMIIKTLGKLLLVEAILLCLPLIVSLIYLIKGVESYHNLIAFLIPIASLIVLWLLSKLVKVKTKTFYAKEGFAIVGLSWIIMSLIGCLPFVISKTIPNYIDAFFETVSGFTTTGSTIVTNIDDWHNGYESLLFWRSFTHWIGGMGVLVFIIAIMPSEGQSIYLMRAESTGPQVGKLVSKMKVTARILYIMYICLTVLEAILLLIGKMPLFDSICNAFATAGTGGFGLYSDSIAHYNIYCQVVIAIFMVIFGINFTLFYLILSGKVLQALKSEELWWFLSIIACATLAIAFNIYFFPSNEMQDFSLSFNNNPLFTYTLFGGTYTSFSLALKDSFFQVASIISTTGFATADFIYWPMFAKAFLFLLMFFGGCAGSTGGGIKVSRFVILFKSIKREILKLIHPRSVNNITLDGQVLDEGVVKGVNNYFGYVIAILIISTIAISINGFDFETTITAVVTCLNNIGPGLGKIIGPTGGFADFSAFSKVFLSILMLIGRLEIYPILVLFIPKVWLNR